MSKIEAIPLLYKKIASQDDPRTVFRASVKGYKYISRMIASGEQTVSTLNTIKQIRSLKLVRKIDFDP